MTLIGTGYHQNKLHLNLMCRNCVAMQRSDINSWQNLRYVLCTRYIFDAICPFGTRVRNLYHIATEQSGVISHLNKVKIYRTNEESISL